MRVQNIEKAFNNIGKFVVHFEMDAGSKKGESFEQTLDVRIFALALLKQQTAGDFRVAGGELRAHVTEKRQFPFVVIQQFITHRIPPLFRRRLSIFRETCRTKCVPARVRSEACPQSENAEYECARAAARGAGRGRQPALARSAKSPAQGRTAAASRLAECLRASRSRQACRRQKRTPEVRRT